MKRLPAIVALSTIIGCNQAFNITAVDPDPAVEPCPGTAPERIDGVCVDHAWPSGRIVEDPTCTVVPDTDGKLLRQTGTYLLWHREGVSGRRLEDAQKECAGKEAGGHRSFRVPTRAELLTLFEANSPTPLDNSCVHQTNPGMGYCSSSFESDGFVYCISAGAGVSATSVDMPIDTLCVKAVGGAPAARFENAGAFVYDTVTDLTWEKDNTLNVRHVTHDEAVAYCAGLGKDFRLPTLRELESLVEEGSVLPAIDPSFFPGIDAWWHWTKDRYLGAADVFWSVDFNHGHSKPIPTNDGRSRCVRTGRL